MYAICLGSTVEDALMSWHFEFLSTTTLVKCRQWFEMFA